MNRTLAMVSMLILFALPVSAHVVEGPAAGASHVAMRMHHLHLRMNHGLAMAVQGANMVMTSQMGMSPHSDAESLRHGLAMIKQGREMIRQAMTGPEMQELHKQVAGKSPLMELTHELDEAMLVVITELEGMHQAPVSSSVEMTLHHMHMLVNHALLMAAEGSRLIMLGQMGMSKRLDAVAVKHGRKMIADARNLWHEAMEGKAMKDLHRKKTDPSALMEATHRYADAAKRLIDLFVKISSAPNPREARRKDQ